MARNAEKAQSTLARFLAAKKADLEGPKEKRPYLSTMCSNLADAEKFRLEIIREAGKKISMIQNPGLGEFRLRDLNDQINNLLRERWHWDNRIIELGGPNYHRASKVLDTDGKEVPGHRGYKYFGAAKDLPGVRELFANEAPILERKTKGELTLNIDADYFGYRDEDDGALIDQESVQEKLAIEKAVTEWRERVSYNAEAGATTGDEDLSLETLLGGGLGRYAEAAKLDAEINPAPMKGSTSKRKNAVHASQKFSHVVIPQQDDVEKMLIERKRKALMEAYASDNLLESEQQSNALIGRKISSFHA